MARGASQLKSFGKSVLNLASNWLLPLPPSSPDPSPPTVIIFFFGFYYMIMESIQMVKLGLATYYSSFWNIIDLASYRCVFQRKTA